MDTERLENERYIIEEIASGVYTKWRINKPSKVQKFLDYIDGRNTANLNDTEMKFKTGSTIVKASTVRNKFNIHSIESVETGDSISVNESVDMKENNKSTFIRRVHEVWKSNAEQI